MANIHVNIDLLLSASDPLHVAFLKWHETATPNDFTNAMICGHAVITSNIPSREAKDIQDHYESEIEQNSIILKTKIQEHNQRINSILQENDTKIKSLSQQHNEHVTSLKRNHNDDIEYYRVKIQENCEQWIVKYETISKEYNAYIKNMAETGVAHQKDQEIMSLKAQLNVLQNTNAFKGAIGELTLRDMLSTHFPAHEIKDTSGQTSMSDIHLIDSEGYIIAIECKNKANITAQDVNKTLTDIKHIKAKYGDMFIGYFFASIRSINIPKKSNLCFEVIDDIPVIWYGAEPNSTTLENDVIKLIKILSMHRTYQSVTDNAATHINEYLQKIVEIKKSIDSLSTSLNAMKGNISVLNSSIDWLWEDMSKLIGAPVIPQSHNCLHCEAVYKRKGDLLRHITAKHP